MLNRRPSSIPRLSEGVFVRLESHWDSKAGGHRNPARGIYGLDPDTKRQTFNLSPLVNAPVTAIVEGSDGLYVWSVAGSSDIYRLYNGATVSVTTGLTTPVMRLDNWGDLLVVQGQNEVRFLDIRGNRNFSPKDVFARDRRPEFDIPTAISQGPCLFSWDRGLGTVIRVARMGQLQTPSEPNGTQDLSYVRAWRVNARRQVHFWAATSLRLYRLAIRTASTKSKLARELIRGR